MPTISDSETWHNICLAISMPTTMNNIHTYHEYLSFVFLGQIVYLKRMENAPKKVLQKYHTLFSGTKQKKGIEKMTNQVEIIEQVNASLTILTEASATMEAVKSNKTSALGLLLESFQNAEIEGLNVNQVKVEVFEANGWTYKVYDEIHDKMVTVEGEKAPANVSTAFSEAKRAYIKYNSLAQFETWEDMRKACKDEDVLAHSKELFREICKEGKKLDRPFIEYIEGALEKLNDEVAKMQSKQK